MKDHPDIRKMENEGVEYGHPVYCPICGEQADDLYTDYYDELVGCNNCIRVREAWEVEL